MHPALRRFSICLPVLLLAAAIAHAAPVLMISIDGMKPEYITQADAHGMKLPFLRTFISEGTYAEGVVGVWPTVTYPSHTTLVTGVWPAEHGILSNVMFDPERKNPNTWYWYAQQIKVPTLRTAAQKAGLRTASVGWPVTVGAADVDYLIPEFWHRPEAPGSTNPADRLLMASLARPANLLSEIEPAAGPYMMGNDTTVAGDEVKTRYTLEILRRYKPAFTTLHLSSLDVAQHNHGPFSAEADADLEALDGMVERLAHQAVASDPAAVVMIVSDHGFMNIYHDVNLYVPFIEAGLMQAKVDPDTKRVTIASWKAEPWMADGMAPIMLHDPNDQETAQQVRTLLDKLAADPDSGVARILDRDAIAKTGGFPDASFLVVLKPGYATGTATSGSLVTPISGTRGTHGFSPEYPEMHSSFFALGAGIAHHRNLGVVDMRQIAPTAAKILHVSLPTAKAAPLHVEP